jgi:hypothetical protein
LSFSVNDEVVESLTREYLKRLVERLYKYTLSHVRYIEKHFKRYFVLEPTTELSIKTFEWGVEIHARIYLDGSEIERLREAVRRWLEDNRLRIKAYADIVKMRIRGKSEELYALLSNLRSSTTEGGGAPRVLREEVWSEEGGSTAEGSEQSDLRGVQVDEEGYEEG